MAERGRFELPVAFQLRPLSRRVHSTTLPPLRFGDIYKSIGKPASGAIPLRSTCESTTRPHSRIPTNPGAHPGSAWLGGNTNEHESSNYDAHSTPSPESHPNRSTY